MALTRCWRKRTKAIPAQEIRARLGIILELPWVASGPWGVPWGDFGVSPGVARAEGSSAGIKQPQSHIAEPVPVFSRWKLWECGGNGGGIWGTRGNSSPEPGIYGVVWGLNKEKIPGSLWDRIKRWICCLKSEY